MTPDEINACWRDPNNRKWGVYYCKADPRVIVPKGVRWMGWTINFARPSALPVLALMVALIGLPPAAVKAIGGGQLLSYICFAMSVAVVCLLCGYLSSSKRWTH